MNRKPIERSQSQGYVFFYLFIFLQQVNISVDPTSQTLNYPFKNDNGMSNAVMLLKVPLPHDCRSKAKFKFLTKNVRELLEIRKHVGRPGYYLSAMTS